MKRSDWFRMRCEDCRDSEQRNAVGFSSRERTRSVLALATLCALATLALASSRTIAADPLDDYRLAVGFYGKSQWKLAAESFQTFLEKNPRHLKAQGARFYYALTLVKLEDLRKAREVLRAYVRDFPQGQEVVAAGYWIGHCSFYLEDYAAAERELAEFLQRAPDDPLREWALPHLADAELRQQKAESALKHFRESLEAYPKGAMADDAKFGQARSLELLRQFDEAIRLYREVAADKQGPNAPEAQLNIGGLLFDAGKFADAALAYVTLDQQFPDSSQAALARLNLGFAHYQLGDYRQAQVAFQKAGKTEKYASEAALWQGLSLKAQGDVPAAAAIFKQGHERFRGQPNAEKLLFQWADCEQRRGEFDSARKLFLDVVSASPKGALADEALHRACVAAINADRIPEAETLLARFDREFPGNKLRFRQEVLKGRLLAAKNDLPEARRQFQSVITASEIDSTRHQARYYLTDVLQRLQQPAQALEVSEPLAALWNASDKGPSDLAGIFVLRAASLLALARETQEPSEDSSAKRARQLADANASAAKYLQIAPAGPLAARAAGVQCLAVGLAGDKPRSVALLSALRQQYPHSADLDQTVYDLGTLAFARQDYEWSETLFSELSSRPTTSRLHARALADLGWSLHKRRKFIEAADAFERLLNEHAADPLVPEAGFMRASSLQEAGRLPEAQAAFSQAFKQQGSSEHVFLAGLQSARLLVRLGKMPEADAVYGEALRRFAGRADADKVLDEWATVHYNAEDFPKADEIFRRLAHEYPQSSLADNAGLSLAESDLIAGRFDPARTAFEKLAAGTTSDEAVQQRALYQLMQIEFETKRWEKLRKVCEESLTRYPKGTYHRDAEWKWAEAEFYSGAYESARERLQKLAAAKVDEALRRATWHSQVWLLLAETHYRLKDYDAVAKTVEEFRAADGQSQLLYQADEILGRSFKAQALWDEARASFQRVIESSQGRQTVTAAKCQYLIGETYHHQRQYDDAVREYLKTDILYNYPEWQAPALYGAGTAYENLSQWKEAARSYDELLRNFPQSEVAPRAKERLDQVRKKLASR